MDDFTYSISDLNAHMKWSSSCQDDVFILVSLSLHFCTYLQQHSAIHNSSIVSTQITTVVENARLQFYQFIKLEQIKHQISMKLLLIQLAVRISQNKFIKKQYILSVEWEKSFSPSKFAV